MYAPTANGAAAGGARDAPDDGEEAERGDELARELRRARAHVPRGGERAAVEHHVGQGDPGERPGELRADVAGHVAATAGRPGWRRRR